MGSLSAWIQKGAKKLNHSTRYKRAKKFFDGVLNDPSNAYKKYVDLLMMFFIISSVAILVYEVRHPVPEWMDIYDIYLVSLVFFVEYLLRLWVHTDLYKMIEESSRRAHLLQIDFSLRQPVMRALKRTFSFMLTPAMIIDFLAILPAYREIRILRVFVLFRVFKLLRYARSLNQFVEVLHNKRFELITLLFLLLFVVTTAGIAIYVFEEHVNPQINTVFDAFYWALVTMTTVGYGDISPVTHEGRTISMIVIVAGIAMISFVTSVIVSAFSEKLIQLKESRIVEQVNKSEAFLLICGYGQMTKMFMRQRDENDSEYIIIEKDKERYNQAIKDGYDAIREDASRHDTLARFNVKHAKITVLCLLNSDIENIYISLNAKSISRHIQVIARASDPSMVKKFKRAGADHIVLPNSVANKMLQTAISKPHLYKAAHAILTSKDVAVFDEIRIYPGDPLIGKKVRDINFKQLRLLLMAIERVGEKDFLFNPSGDTVLKNGDVLVLMGYRIGLDYFKEFYHESVR
jgi:voltage-gated potassium channel